MPKRPIAMISVIVLILTACTNTVSNESTTATAITFPETTTSTSIPQVEGLIAQPVRHPATAAPMYFVMTDRFANGDPTNDTGSIDPGEGPTVHGFLPTDTGYFHGGDIAGLTERLDYIAGLGMKAIWITPPFVNRVVQGNGTIDGSSAGYHGYWNIDWSRVDPHLGDSDDMVEFIDAANQRGIDVYFDIVVNHTGDVIAYDEDSYVYRGTGSTPFLTAAGEPFDPAEVAGTDQFPALAAEVSFPYLPIFLNDDDATIKAPAWLNDLTVYHNRGDSTFNGESSFYGDFFGLDDLFTEDPRVVQGMIDLYSEIIATYAIAGFRVDTAKHVNDQFWVEFLPAIQTAAREAGRDDFLVFGEVFTEDPIFTSAYSTVMGFSSTLDFRFDAAVRQFVINGVGASILEQAFDDDDWFTDADSNASMNVKFLGNHDIGRLGYFVDSGTPGDDEAERLDRMRVAFDLMFTTRGVPLVYYGDEQGFTGSGGDKAARQSMFASVAPDYLDDDLLGTDDSHAQATYDTNHPLYRYIAELGQIREAHPALVTGAQITRKAQTGAFAFSRIDRDERIEYVVVVNRGDARPVTLTTATPDGVFTSIHPTTTGLVVTATGNGTISVDMPAKSTAVLVADRKIAVLDTPVEITFERPREGIQIPTVRYRVEANLSDARFAEVTFSARIDGAEPILLGVDDAPPYRVYWNTAAFPEGAEVEFLVVVNDFSDRVAEASVVVSIGERR